MEKKIGFIGCGNMGKAILGGLIASGQVLPGQIWVYTPSPDKVAALHDQFGINAAESAQEVAQIADIIFAAVKPGIMIKVLSEITSSLNKDSLVVSIAAGVTLDQLARALGHDRKIIRAMPNTPALVNAGMTSVTPNALVTPEDTADVLNIFRCFGEAEVIAEPMIHPVVGVSGSAPAYVFMFIEAMADAAVLGGIGSVTGAVLGGFILGFTEVVAVAIFPELGGYKDAFAFLFLILVLLFRPVGIMGDERLERSRF